MHRKSIQVYTVFVQISSSGTCETCMHPSKYATLLSSAALTWYLHPTETSLKPVLFLYECLFFVIQDISAPPSNHISSTPHPSSNTLPLRHNNNPNTPRLPNHTPRHTLQTQPTQPRLTMLNLRNLIYMLQAHGTHGALDCIPDRRTTRRRLALLSIVIVHGAGHISSATDLVLGRQDAGGAEEEGGCGRGAQLEVEGAVWADCYACGDGGAGCVVCGSGVELLWGWLLVYVWDMRQVEMKEHTLQKSMLFTPLEPSAGPTGGEGEACPAPTISLTIWSFAIAFRAMVGWGVWFWCWGGLLGDLRRGLGGVGHRVFH
jgi:hypothetical protein